MSVERMRAKQNSIRMIRDRGFDIKNAYRISQDEGGFDIEERDDSKILKMNSRKFYREYSEVDLLNSLYTKKVSRGEQQTIVVFLESEKHAVTGAVRPKVLVLASKILADPELQETRVGELGVILVTNNKLHHMAFKEFSDPNLVDLKRSIFLYSDLQAELPVSPMVPYSEKVPKNEVYNVLRRINCVDRSGPRPDLLQKMMETDKQARWFDYQAGDIIFLLRHDPYNGIITPENISYRQVIPALIALEEKKSTVVGFELKSKEQKDTNEEEGEDEDEEEPDFMEIAEMMDSINGGEVMDVY